MKHAVVGFLLIYLASRIAGAQSVDVPNAGFEAIGKGGVPGWETNDPAVTNSSSDCAEGRYALGISQNPDNTVGCISSPLTLEPLATYAMRYQVKTTPYEEGPPIAGPLFSNYILYNLEENVWQDQTLYFQVPSGLTPEVSRIRLGHARMRGGSVLYDDVSVYRAHPIYTSTEDITIGIGETLRGNTYTCAPVWDTQKINVCRPLVDYRKSVYNHDCFLMGDGSSILMKHVVGSRSQVSALLRIEPRYYFSGKLIVEASADGESWTELGEAADDDAHTFEIPQALLPAKAVWIRLRVESEKPVGWNLDLGALGVTSYHYEAEFDGGPVPYTEGATRFVEVPYADPAVNLQVVSAGESVPEGENAFVLKAEYSGVKADTARCVVATAYQGKSSRTRQKIRLEPGANTLEIPYKLLGMGENEVLVQAGSEPLFQLRYRPYVSAVFDTDYGELLPGSSGGVALWWASSGYKVSPARPVPTAKAKRVEIALARNETEAAQLVVCPAKTLEGLTASATELTGPGGASIPAGAVEFAEVRYIEVHTPTDRYGAAGSWPDPLPPLTEALTVQAGSNQPLWVRVHAPKDMPAGKYKGAIRLAAEDFEAEVPLHVLVYDFTLPDRTTVDTAFGMSMSRVFQYQNPQTNKQRHEIAEKYLAAISRYRMSPYDPAPLARFGVNWPDTEGVRPEDLQVRFNWAPWDAAVEHAMDTYHFNSMRMSLPGLGSGNHEGENTRELRGFAEGTPEFEALFHSYATQFEAHLKEKGWLDEAYIYWFDEPRPEHYAHVMGAWELLKTHALGLRRMLTEQVEPELVGGPNLWCPMISTFQPEFAEERRAAGDHYWWYVCTIPKEPYLGLFIDRPATDLRLWLWQTWQYGIEGVLIWETCYWTSPAAFPSHPQNPYEDPMGWVSSRSLKAPWGNGDGRLFYPPEAAAEAKPGRTVVEGPIPTQRIEMLRDGIEDYEYFAMLKRLLDEKGGQLSKRKRAEYEALLVVPEEVSQDRLNYTTRPEPIARHREKLAQAIVHLSALDGEK